MRLAELRILGLGRRLSEVESVGICGLQSFTSAMKGWRKLASASLEAAAQEIEDISEAELLRESSDSDSEPSPIPCSSQTSDEPWQVLGVVRS